MKQTKLVSLIEAFCNIGSGFVISLVVWQFMVAPLFGYEVTFADNLALTSIFTVVSIIRSYAWRRFFNAGLHRAAVMLVGGRDDKERNLRGPRRDQALGNIDVLRTPVLDSLWYSGQGDGDSEGLVPYQKCTGIDATWTVVDEPFRGRVGEGHRPVQFEFQYGGEASTEEEE